MGSRSVSTSNTTYQNLPQTVSDNGIALASSNLVTGFQGTQNTSSEIRDSTFNSLDGGAIASAFGFGSNVIKGFFEAQKQNNALISATNSASNGIVSKVQDSVDKKENLSANTVNMTAKTIWILAAVVGAYFVFKGKI